MLYGKYISCTSFDITYVNKNLTKGLCYFIYIDGETMHNDYIYVVENRGQWLISTNEQCNVLFNSEYLCLQWRDKEVIFFNLVCPWLLISTHNIIVHSF